MHHKNNGGSMLKNILKILLVFLLFNTVTGCFFSAKEIVLDPDKGTLHTNKSEVYANE